MATAFDRAFAPYAMPQSNNVLAQVLGAQDTGPIGIPQVDTSAPLATPSVRMPRERASLLDIIGGIADTVATVGGSAPMYQPSIDAREDRQRQMEMDEIRKRISEQTIQQNEQTLGNFGREQLGQTLAGIIGSENPAEEFARIAEVAGIPEAQRAQIQQNLAQGVDPERLARAFGYAPPAQGSMPKELQIYEMLAARDPQAAEQYLARVVEGGGAEGMTPYQQARLSLDERKFRQDVREFENPRPSSRAGGGGLSLTPGQKKVDEAFAKDFAQYEAAGGFADVEKSIQQLREARAALEEGGLTGGITGYIPTWAGRTVVNPRSVAVQQQVEEVVQRNLRLILGAQFTQKEGERLIERSFDPKLSEAENIAKLDRIIQQIETAARTKEEAGQYFAQNGTLQGWRGRLPAGVQAPSGGGRSAPAANRAAPPRPGTVRNGWRFNGGNPADRSNWTKVQ